MRKRLEPEERLSCALRAYVTPRELEAVDAMAAVYGRSEIIRRALALYIRTNYPELTHKLREDIKGAA